MVRAAKGKPVEAIGVPGVSVSANHVLVWSDSGAVCIKDLDSRNGTWVRLHRGEALRIPASEVVVQLGQFASVGVADGEPEPPSWTGSADYGKAIATSVEAWLQTRGLRVSATVVAEPNDDTLANCIPLATREAVEIVPLGTVDPSWAPLMERLWRWTTQQNSIFEAEETTRREGMILASRAIRSAHRETIDAAKNGVPTLLLTGATGAGKEMLAEAYHRHSGRSGSFVAVNCALFVRDLLRSELFGAEIGAFTGATRRIVGAVERAAGGTLFLDEIGEMTPDVQAMLLRFLDRREYERLGLPGKPQYADVRVVAATNRDLREAARAGTFRVDLWFRLSPHEVVVPALGARWDDVEAYLGMIRLDGGRCSAFEAISHDAQQLLRAHPWEGNFRELAAFTARLPRNATRDSIDGPTCRHALDRSSLRPSTPTPPAPDATLSPDWSALADRALEAFREDHGRGPGTWDDQKEWNEKYLKPLLFSHMSGASGQPVPADDGSLANLAAKTASRLRADRGTASKQLARYFDRFRS